MAQIDPHGAHDADRIDAEMAEKTLIFDGENRLDQQRRNFGQLDDVALLPNPLVKPVISSGSSSNKILVFAVAMFSICVTVLPWSEIRTG